MKGRKPSINRDNSIEKDNPEFVKLREEKTPLYEKAEFLVPEHFNEAEKKEWIELVELLNSIKGSAVTDADRKIMIIRVQAWIEFLRFDSELKKRPDTYLLLPKKDKSGDMVYVHVKNQNYDLRKKASDTVLKCDAELGLTPISRARTGLARTQAAFNDADALLSGILNRRGDND